MDVLDAERAAERVDDLVHFDTQEAPTGLDLTVGAVHRIRGAGALDFGGSEFQAADTEAIEPELKSPDDDYGWWSLDGGFYRIEYNEGFSPRDGEYGVVRPLGRLLRAGASHAAFDLDGGLDTVSALLQVGPRGVEMKENFRASRLQVYRRD